jgi:site-specific DNA recombinase
MKGAIYSRKSTEQNVSEDARSVTRQAELARAFAAEKNWTVVEEYVDDGVSGALTEKLVSRARMLAAATEGRFQALIVRDLDRLSRNDEELPSLVYALRDCGVEIWCYADRSRVDTRTALNRGMLSMRATFAAAEREAAQTRTREAMRRKAERGEVAGGRVLGYTNVRQPGGPVLRVVNAAEAAIVRRIFDLCAQGRGLLKTARTLNAEGVENPSGQDRSRASKRVGSWSTSGLRAILHRELYRGRIVYGATQNDYRGGKRIKVPPLAGEAPIVLEQPELRIVSQELWQAAHERMAATHAALLRRTDGQMVGRPASGLESKYLLSGMLSCGACGGRLVINKTMGSRGRPQTRYQCANQKSRPGSCPNKHGLPVVKADEAVVFGLFELLSWGVVVDRLKASLTAPADAERERATAAARVSDLDGRLARLLDLAEISDVPDVKTRLSDLRGQRDEASARLEHLEGLTLAGAPDLTTEEGRAAWIAALEPLLANLRETLTGNPARARQQLRQILSGPITATPQHGPDGLTWDLRGLVSFQGWHFDLATGKGQRGGRVERPLAAQVLNKRGSVASVWCPRGDSNTRHAV